MPEAKIAVGLDNVGAKLNSKDFGEKSPGKLVPTIEGVEAFVPSAIPRELPFSSSVILLNGRAENALGRLTGTTRGLMNPYLVGSPLLRREAILSSRIEGTYTTPEQLVLLEATGTSPDKTEDTREVQNYMLAMNRGIELLASLPMCLRVIREVHEVLLRGVRGDKERPGEFRQTQNFIGRKGGVIRDARFVPPPPKEMDTALSDLEKYLNDTPEQIPSLVQMALVHYQFEAIHPFRDGNGRVGRLLIPLTLCAQRRMQEPLLYLSSFFEIHNEEYVDLLLGVSQRGEWLEWIAFFLRAVVECSEESLIQCEALIKLWGSYRARFQRARNTALLLKMIDDLFLRPSTTIRQTATLVGVTAASASGNIAKLVDVGILREITGRTRDQVFVAPEILAFMTDMASQKTAGPQRG